MLTSDDVNKEGNCKYIKGIQENGSFSSNWKKAEHFVIFPFADPSCVQNNNRKLDTFVEQSDWICELNREKMFLLVGLLTLWMLGVLTSPLGNRSVSKVTTTPSVQVE